MIHDDEEAHANLKKYGDAFRYQLVAALHVDEWAQKLGDPDDPLPNMHPVEIRGWVNALQNVAAMLRQGNYLPGAAFEQFVRTELRSLSSTLRAARRAPARAVLRGAR